MVEAGLMKKSSAIKPETTSEERTWATVAHLSTLLTVLVSLGTGGLGGLIFVFVPFVIYMVYRDKSDFVAYQAAQAFAIQLGASVGFFVLILAGVLVITVAWLVTVILSFILIGLILIPVAALISVIIPVGIVLFPAALAVFSVVAGIQAGNGTEYRAPYVGAWTADWMAKYQADRAEQAVPAE